jgi:hypothetical protein
MFVRILNDMRCFYNIIVKQNVGCKILCSWSKSPPSVMGQIDIMSLLTVYIYMKKIIMSLLWYFCQKKQLELSLRKHQTIPNEGTFYKITGLYFSKGQ